MSAEAVNHQLGYRGACPVTICWTALLRALTPSEGDGRKSKKIREWLIFQEWRVHLLSLRSSGLSAYMFGEP
jgi:hypothetical protein